MINRIGNFESGITSLQNPSFVSQILSLSQVPVAQAYSFWKWGALIIAMVASLGTIVSRIKVLVIRLRQRYCSSVGSEPLLRMLDDDDFSDVSEDEAVDEDDDASWSSSSSVSEFVDEDNDTTRSIYDDGSWRHVDERFCVRGSGHYVDDHQGQKSNLRQRRRKSLSENRFSWSDFATGKSVVKLWDSLGLGLDLDDTSGKVVSMYDMDRQQKIGAVVGGKLLAPATATSLSSAILSAETALSGTVSLGVWDTRAGCRNPAMFAKWGPHLGEIVGITSNGAEKVYVRDDVTGGLTIGDLRNVSSPLKRLTESEVETTWWDADAVMVSDECFDESDAQML